MSSYSREIQQKAKEKAGKIVHRAAKDGKISGSEFEKLERDGLYGGPVSGPRSTYVANAIAREIRRNPDLVIGKGATDATGVKLTKGGRLVHDPGEDRPGFNLFGFGDDPGSAKWAQNSKGSYTYLGDIFGRGRRKAEEEPGADQTPTTTVDADPSQDLLNAAEAVNGGGTTAGSGNGSIHFNPGDDMIAATADYGNRATDDYFNRFLPDLKNQSILQALEIGNSAGFHIGRMNFDPPELGNPKDLYKWYGKRLNKINA